MAFKEFRWIKKYVGRYRVKSYYDLFYEDFPRDEDGNIDENFDDLYIPCKKRNAIIKHTYIRVPNDVILVWYCESNITGKNVKKLLDEKFKNEDIWYECADEGKYDYFIYFKDSDFDKFVDIFEPSDYGCHYGPFSSKNLPKVSYTIPEKDMDKYSKFVNKLDKDIKVSFLVASPKKFYDTIKELNGKKCDIKEMSKKSRLKGKEFIHSIGLWDKYIALMEERLKNYDEERSV